MQSKRKSAPETPSSPAKDTSPEKTASTSAKKDRKTKKLKTSNVALEQPLISIEKELEKAIAKLKKSETTTPAKSTRPRKDERMDTTEDAESAEPVASTSKPAPEPTPRFKKKEKGKGREEEIPLPESDRESEVDVEDIETEEDVDIIMEFEVLDMDRDTAYGSGTSFELVTEFKNPPLIYSEDHMAPFRGLMGDMKDSTAAERGKEIVKRIGPNPSKKLLVVTSGKQPEINKVRS